MVDVNKLKGLFREKGITIEEAAKIAHISAATMTRRLSTGVFGTDEIDNLVHGLQIDNPESIFFAKEVT